MLWIKMGSNLILNSPKMNNKIQKMDLEILILFGLTHHSTKQYSQILQKYFFDWSIDSLIDYTVKVSYSCMQYMSKIYKGHNSKIISAPCNQLTWCSCREKGECLMDGKCQTMDAVYDCRVTSAGPQKTFFRFAEGKWKQKYHNHKKSCNHKRYSHETTLSSYEWHLKEILDATPNLKWSVVRCATNYSNISKMCLFCLYENLVIINYPRQHELLN